MPYFPLASKCMIPKNVRAECVKLVARATCSVSTTHFQTPRNHYVLYGRASANKSAEPVLAKTCTTGCKASFDHMTTALHERTRVEKGMTFKTVRWRNFYKMGCWIYWNDQKQPSWSETNLYTFQFIIVSVLPFRQLWLWFRCFSQLPWNAPLECKKFEKTHFKYLKNLGNNEIIFW